MPLPSNRAIAVPSDRAEALAERGRRTGQAESAPRIPKRDPSWRRPPRRRVLAIRDRLRDMYGRPVNQPHGHPIAELVRTILSQNTNDRNRDVAYGRMRDRFPTWEEVRDAPPAELEEALRPGGLAPSKTPRIQHVLEQLGDPPDLDWLAEAPREQALAYLTELPGVGRKTAACVLIFTFDRPEVPVDTHVKRVGERLALFRPGASFDEAHDEMLAITPREDAYEFHINLIRHGRALCRPRPKCDDCELRRMCPYFKGVVSIGG